MIPKAELHVHLEGTLSPLLAKEIATRNHIRLPDNLLTPDQSSYQFNDFLHFLKVYDDVAAVIKKPIDYYDLTFDYLTHRAQEGTIYVEMSYSPDHAEQSSGIPSDEHLAAIQQAIDDAETQFNIVGRIILIAVRHFGSEAALKVAQQGIKKPFPCVVGFGLGGDELNYPPKLFTKAYQTAAEGGLHCTVHAGEHVLEGMLEAIEHLPIKRIGHGVLAITCPKTLAKLRTENIHLEVCPTSNVILGLYQDIDHHPIAKLLNENIHLSINSDDPPFFRTTLGQEYQLVQQHFKFSDEQMIGITRMAIEASFVDESTKYKLLQRIKA